MTREEKIERAARQLISDITNMRNDEGPWFGPFSEFRAASPFDGMSIEWPNLDISVRQLQEAIKHEHPTVTQILDNGVIEYCPVCERNVSVIRAHD